MRQKTRINSQINRFRILIFRHSFLSNLVFKDLKLAYKCEEGALVVKDSGILKAGCEVIGNLKSTTVGVFTPWKCNSHLRWHINTPSQGQDSYL